MKKPKSLTRLKNDLLDLISLYNKIIYSDDNGNCTCYTCGAPMQVGTSNCQNGHCFPRGLYSGLAFELDNMRLQCYRCNISLGGNYTEFQDRLKKEIGEEQFNRLYDNRFASGKFSRTELMHKTITMKALIQKAINEK